ncbi:D-alanine--D-alanine ligase [Geosporobacter ferrireducens]|uniref:D-alanine--D-alanine ligase n=1 Tax=Geosporobacter ferrireducens TaxID=1424294 RepID=A0A1D8GCJ3_9FIRM|nr:D-alanine--D-alanine ligase [Geosporobacter ferrireducens]AOT68635.1 D-alanine--D-alanine ligase [Geosporobacter ferrireducens]
MKTNVYVIYGGRSVEHEISLKTASFILNALDKEKYNVYPVYITMKGAWFPLEKIKEEILDVKTLQRSCTDSAAKSIGSFFMKDFRQEERSIVFPALHGTNGEDGTIQGFLELLRIPYVGNGVLASAAGIDKVVMKDLFANADIPQVKYIPFSLNQWMNNEQDTYKEIEKIIGYPCFVKPARLGSSVGINRCVNREELEEAVKEAFLYDRKLVIEEEVIGREMQIAVVGNDDPIASVVGEFIQERPFMDYNAKYLDGKLVSVIPARLPADISQKMRETSNAIFKLLNCSGLVRVDYFVTDKNRFFVNEVNTMPGLTKLSMFPALCEKTSGMTKKQLIEKLIELGFERYEQQQSILNARWEK